MGILDGLKDKKKDVTKDAAAPKPALADKKPEPEPIAQPVAPVSSAPDTARDSDVTNLDDHPSMFILGPDTPSGQTAAPELLSGVGRQFDAALAEASPASAPEPAASPADTAAAILEMVGRRSEPPPAPTAAPKPAVAPPQLPQAQLAAPNPMDFAPAAPSPWAASPSPYDIPAPAVASAPMDSKLTAMVEAGRKAAPAPVTSGPMGAGPKSPGPKEDKAWKRWTKRVAVVVAIVAAAILGKECGTRPAPPQIIEQGCKAPNVCMVDPKPVKCDVNKGTPGTMFFDPNCGYCGETDKAGNYVKKDWMTAANCPILFTCPNGVQDNNTPYPIYVKNEKGEFKWSTANVTESCKPKDANYCKDDCPDTKAAATGRGGGAGSASPVSSGVVPQPETAGKCSAERLGKLTPAVRNAWNGACDAVKGLLDGKDANIGTAMTVKVGSDGSASVQSASADGKPVSRGIVSLEGASTSSGEPCTGTIGYTIPRCR